MNQNPTTAPAVNDDVLIAMNHLHHGVARFAVVVPGADSGVIQFQGAYYADPTAEEAAEFAADYGVTVDPSFEVASAHGSGWFGKVVEPEKFTV